MDTATTLKLNFTQVPTKHDQREADGVQQSVSAVAYIARPNTYTDWFDFNRTAAFSRFRKETGACKIDDWFELST